MKRSPICIYGLGSRSGSSRTDFSPALSVRVTHELKDAAARPPKCAVDGRSARREARGSFGAEAADGRAAGVALTRTSSRGRGRRARLRRRGCPTVAAQTIFAVLVDELNHVAALRTVIFRTETRSPSALRVALRTVTPPRHYMPSSQTTRGRNRPIPRTTRAISRSAGLRRIGSRRRLRGKRTATASGQCRGYLVQPKTAVTASAATLTDVVEPTIVP